MRYWASDAIDSIVGRYARGEHVHTLYPPKSSLSDGCRAASCTRSIAEHPERPRLLVMGQEKEVVKEGLRHGRISR